MQSVPPKSSWLKSLIRLVALGLLIFAVIWIYNNHQALVDQWRLHSYQPPQAIVSLADETTMTAKARNIFYASYPSVDTADSFNRACGVQKEATIVLGCYQSGSQRIYIYDVNDSRLDGVEQVTAAHETLHAIYARLSDSQRQYVDGLLQQQMDTLSGDSHLRDLIKIYNKKEPGELLNEMHSILGTEYSNLNPKLEAYYQQYFTNRAAIVSYANSYKDVFESMQAQLSQNEKVLRDLKQKIDSLTTDIDSQKANLAQQSSQLDSLRATDPTAYNQQVPAYNSMVNQYNASVSRYKNLVDQYNDQVKVHNSIAIDYNNLNHELDSTYQPIDR